jgi:cytochrome c oxidase subunit 3
MTTHSHHPFHLVDIRPWPITASIGALTITSGLSYWFHYNSITILSLGLFIIIISSYQWWRDIAREGTLQGLHNRTVITNLRWGIILFIVSEIFFFLSFFWAFFHARLAPSVEIGTQWPPAGIIPFNPFQIPLLNTAILLASGVTITWSHHALISANHSQATQALTLTIILGVYFTALQAYEYIEAPFTIAEAVYGSTFFVATGFHGLHVIIGSTFLMVCLFRIRKFHFSATHHFGFEAAAWYWHFVDVVWLFLYVSIYWWGGCLISIISIIDFQSVGPNFRIKQLN